MKSYKNFTAYFYRSAKKHSPEIGPILETNNLSCYTKKQALLSAKTLAKEQDWRFLEIRESEDL